MKSISDVRMHDCIGKMPRWILNLVGWCVLSEMLLVAALAAGLIGLA